MLALRTPRSNASSPVQRHEAYTSLIDVCEGVDGAGHEGSDEGGKGYEEWEGFSEWIRRDVEMGNSWFGIGLFSFLFTLLMR